MQRESLNEAIKAVANACPYYKLLGMEVVEMGEGSSRLRMPFDEKLIQPAGVVHGGAVGSLADSAVAVALLSMLEPGTDIATVEMKINFLAPVRSGVLFADAKVAWRGTRLALGEVDVTDENGGPVAKSLMTYMVMPRQEQGEGGGSKRESTDGSD